MRRDDIIDFGLVGLLTLMWGSAFAFIEIALRDFSPAMIAFIRIALAAVLIAVYAIVRHSGLPHSGRHWVLCAALGFFGFAAPFILIPYGQEYVSSGTAALLMAISPISTLFFAHFLTHDEKVTTRRMLGVSIGFVGIIILFGGDVALGGQMLIGGPVLIAAALCYAIAGIIMKQMSAFSATASSAGSLIMATLICIPALALRNDFAKLADVLNASSAALISLLVLAIGATGLAAIIVLILVRRRGATFTATSNYGVPACGVILGILFLEETARWNILVTLALIIAAIWLTSGKTQAPQTPRAERA
ncbi:MAG: DMT family transporter [Pseudomonadota bacterium]